MQKVIKKIFTNTVETKFGTKTKYDVYVDSDQGEFKFQAWGGNWNKDWNQGVSIEVPEGTDSRWKKADYQGKQFFTLGAPPEAMQSYGDASTQPAQQAPQEAPAQGLDPSAAFGTRMTTAEQEIVLVKKTVEKLETEMADFKFKQMEDSIEKDKGDGIPIIEEGVDIADVPF